MIHVGTIVIAPTVSFLPLLVLQKQAESLMKAAEEDRERLQSEIENSDQSEKWRAKYEEIRKELEIWMQTKFTANRNSFASCFQYDEVS